MEGRKEGIKERKEGRKDIRLIQRQRGNRNRNRRRKDWEKDN